MSRSAVRTACAFGVACVLLSGLFAVRPLRGVATLSGGDRVFVVVALCATAVVALLLLAGSVALWMQSRTGQILVIVGASAALALVVSYSVYSYFHGPEAYGRGDLSTAVAHVLLGVAAALGALFSAAAVRPSKK